MNDNNMEERLTAFKMLLLRKMPFYGDLLTNIPIVSDPTIPTACTDGRTIRFNPVFRDRLAPRCRLLPADQRPEPRYRALNSVDQSLNPCENGLY